MALSTLRHKHPELFNQIDRWLNINSPVDYNTLKPSSRIKLSWTHNCYDCGRSHSFIAPVSDRVKYGQYKYYGCPYCNPNGKKVCPCHSVAAQSPLLMLDFRQDLNPGIDMYALKKGSNVIINWYCHRAKCEHHQWPSMINTRTGGNENNISGCPFCYNWYFDPCVSVAKMYPHLVKQFHPTLNRPDLDLDKLLPGSHERIWWLCEEGLCGHHEWDTFLYSRAKEDGSGCPFCSHKRCCSCTSIVITHPKIAAEYDLELNKRDINTVSRCSNGKFWWKCVTHGSWEALVSNRTRKNYGCPRCRVSHMEKKCIEILMGIFGLEAKVHFDTEYSFADCVNPQTGHVLKFDIIIKNVKYIVLIELDGEQHFNEMRFFHQSTTLEIRKYRDWIKNFYCYQNKISLLRISYSEADNMLDHLIAFLGAIVDDNISKPVILFMGKEYEDPSYW